VVGAGNSFDNGRDDFSGMDAWHSYARGVVTRGANRLLCLETRSWSSRQKRPVALSIGRGLNTPGISKEIRVPPNKQLQRTVIRRRGRAASTSFHCAHAARWTRGHAAAQLRR
jgi:hypothetical protein